MIRVRVVTVAIAVVSALLAAGFLVRAPWALRIWPFARLETPLGFLFLASIVAAIAAPNLWIGLTGEVRAAEGGAVNLVVALFGMAIFLAARSHGAARPDLRWAAAVALLLSAGALLGFFAVRRFPWRDQRPMPSTVRGSFALFAAVLLAVSAALIARLPRIFPWPLAPDSSVMYGLIFLGAAAYFVYGLLRPRWPNTMGQLLAFLTYDLVLIGPFVRRFAVVPDAHRLSLTVYTVVLVYSGLLALYYLALPPRTRASAVRSSVA